MTLVICYAAMFLLICSWDVILFVLDEISFCSGYADTDAGIGENGKSLWLEFLHPNIIRKWEAASFWIMLIGKKFIYALLIPHALRSSDALILRHQAPPYGCPPQYREAEFMHNSISTGQ